MLAEKTFHAGNLESRMPRIQGSLRSPGLIYSYRPVVAMATLLLPAMAFSASAFAPSLAPRIHAGLLACTLSRGAIFGVCLSISKDASQALSALEQATSAICTSKDAPDPDCTLRIRRVISQLEARIAVYATVDEGAAEWFGLATEDPAFEALLGALVLEPVALAVTVAAAVC